MAKVQVRNLDNRDYTEMFRDEEVFIPANGHIEMGRAEAVAFVGQVTPLNVDGSGRCIKPKKLEIYQDPEVFAAERDQPDKLEAPDGKWFKTQQGYDNYLLKMKSEAATPTNEVPPNGEPVKRTRVRTAR